MTNREALNDQPIGALCQRAAHDVEQLVGDGLLAALVVEQRQLLDEVVGVVGGHLHRHRAGGVLGRARIQGHGVELHAEHPARSRSLLASEKKISMDQRIAYIS